MYIIYIFIDGSLPARDHSIPQIHKWKYLCAVVELDRSECRNKASASEIPINSVVD